ncbi:hypothetical protein JW905_08480 [bacterium]|nr:hypothetical protein [candidate division CSSED10-310 bacterium]
MRRRTIAIVLIAAALALLVEARSTFRMAFDIEVLNNFIEPIHHGTIGESTWTWVFGDIPGRGHYFRPTSPLLYLATYPVFGINYGPYKLVLLALHIGVALLVFSLAGTMFGDRSSAWFGAMIMLLWPPNMGTVVWLNGDEELLLGVSQLLCLAAYARLVRTGRRAGGATVIGMAGFLFALCSKESALAIPLLLALIELSMRNEGTRDCLRLRERLLRIAPFGFMAAAYLVLRFVSWGHAVGYEVAGTSVHAHFGWFIIPRLGENLMASFGIQWLNRSPWLLLAAVVPLAAALASKRRGVRFGAWYYLICVLPFLNIPVRDIRLYVPSAGISIALGSLGADAWRAIPRGTGRKIAHAVLIAGMLLFVTWGHHHAIDRHQRLLKKTAMSYGVRHLAPEPGSGERLIVVDTTRPRADQMQKSKHKLSQQTGSLEDRLRRLIFSKDVNDRIRIVPQYELDQWLQQPRTKFYLMYRERLVPLTRKQLVLIKTAQDMQIPR